MSDPTSSPKSASAPGPATASPRFAQLTYSSFDQVGLDGGWQIKEVRGGLTDGEQELLRSKVATRFDAAQSLPQFPTPEEVAALPRRLLYEEAGAGRAGLWHTVPAGVDGFGRPGNVFAHVVLDRDTADSSGALRPIDLWRSGDWLAPYGPDQVLAAHLAPADRPGAGTLVSKQAVLDFLLDPTRWRIGVLSVLLDAVTAALAGGQRVILGAETVDSAALWIGAVSHLMSPGTSRTFYWSTLERTSSTTVPGHAHLHLCCVPRGDLASLRPDVDAVLIDELGDVELGDWRGEPHSTSHGSPVIVTPWSIMAQVVLQERGCAERALAAVDQIATRVGDRRLHPAWPLAMVVSQGGDEFSDAREEAAHIVLRHSPNRLPADAALLSVAAESVRELLGSDTASIWAQLDAAVQPDLKSSVIADLVLRVYVERCMHDDDWLLRPAGVPIPAALPPFDSSDDPVWQAARTKVELIDQTARSGSGDSMTQAVLAARVASFIGGLGLLAHDIDVSRELREQLDVLLERCVVPVLFVAEQAWTLMDRVGPVPDRVQAVTLRPLVAFAEQLSMGRIGERLHEDVTGWLFPGGQTALRPDADSGEIAETPDALEVERAVHVVRRCAADDPTTLAVRETAITGALLARETGSFVSLGLAQLLGTFPWPPTALIRILRRFPGGLPPRYCLPTITTSPWDTSLLELCELVAGDARSGRLGYVAADDSTALSVASLRLLAEGAPWWMATPASRVPITAREILDRAQSARQSSGPRLPGSLVARIRAAYAIAVLDGWQTWSVMGVPGVGRDRMSTAAEQAQEPVQILDEWLSRGRMPLAEVAYVALVGKADFPSANVGNETYRHLATINAQWSGSSAPLLDQVIRQRLSREGAPERNELVGEVADKVRKHVQWESGSVDRTMAECEKFIGSWLKNLAPSSSGLLGGTRSKFRRS